MTELEDFKPDNIYIPPPEGEPLIKTSADGDVPPLARETTAVKLASVLGTALLAGVLVALLLHWNEKESAPLTGAEAQQMQTALDYREAGMLSSPGRLLSYEFRPQISPSPPLYPLAAAAMMPEGSPEKGGIRVNALFLGLLVIACWGVGYVFGGWKSALYTAILASCCAAVQGAARVSGPELALAAITASAYWAYLSSDRFRRAFPSLLAGLLFGAAALTRWNAFIYFIPMAISGAAALSDRRGRLGAGLALIAAVVVAGPWYRSFWPLLVPGLLDAGLNASSPMTTYFGALSLGLELPMLAAAAAAIAAISRLSSQRHLNILSAWAFVPLLLLSLAPDRQAALLLPSLAPLAALVSGLRAPRAVPALCAFQLLSALNFGFGALPRLGVNLPVLPFAVLTSRPPSAEDWKLREILGEVGKSGSGRQDLDYLLVLSDHPRFSPATFDWESRLLGLEKVKIRYSGRNMGSFSNFVLMKLAEKDVPGVLTLQINPFGNMTVADGGDKGEGGDWFRQAYKALQNWRLPDASRGVVFWRSMNAVNPFRERKVYFNYYKDNIMEATGMSIDLGEWDAARGVHDKVVVHAAELTFDGLKATNVHVEMHDLTLLPIRNESGFLMDSSLVITGSTSDLLLNFRFVRMRRLRILAASVTAKAAEKYLVSKADMPGVKMKNISLNKEVKIDATVLNMLPVSAEASTELSADGRGLDVLVTRARVAGVPVPVGLLLGERVKMKLAFDMNLPFEVEVAPFKIRDGKVRVREEGGAAQ